MSSTLYFYSPYERKELHTIWEGETQWLDDFLHELYESSDDKNFLQQLDSYADELSLVEAHPIHEELTIDDLNIAEDDERYTQLKNFFASCRSCLIFQNLPDFHLNPLQVSVILHALKSLPEVLVDGFEQENVCLGIDFSGFVQQRFKNLVITSTKTSVDKAPKQLRVDVDDPLVERVNRILLIIRGLDTETRLALKSGLAQRHPKLEKLVEQLNAGTNSPSILWQKSGLNAKDFSDGIERIYFFYQH